MKEEPDLAVSPSHQLDKPSRPKSVDFAEDDCHSSYNGDEENGDDDKMGMFLSTDSLCNIFIYYESRHKFCRLKINSTSEIVTT